MPVRVSPKEQNPTHHISLSDRSGRTVGLILCNEDGSPIKSARGAFNKIAAETTAQKQTSGTSSYNDYQFPYSPIVQDDLSGGRGSLDFERDSTKFYDSFRTLSARSNKAYAGPQEQFTEGVRNAKQQVPGNVSWHTLTGNFRYLYYRFQADFTDTAGLIWLLARRRGTPGNLTLALYSDNSGDVNAELDSVTVPYTRLPDLLSEWLCETVSQSLSSGTYYWLVVYSSADDDAENNFQVAVNEGTGYTYYSASFDTTPTSLSRDVYFRVTTANTEKSCIPFQYKEQQYFVVSGTSGAPKLYMAGQRGTADSNSGQLSKLIDATQSWTADEHIGKVVRIIDGPGATELQPWRVITANGTGDVTVSPDWTIEHTTATEYVILGDELTEITGHGLTAPVTSVYVSTKGVIYFAQGDSVNIRRAKYETSGGAWTASYADDSTNKATFFTYMPVAGKIVIANQRDASNNTSIAKASVPDWGTDLSPATAVPIDSKYIRINGMAVYPDDQGDEALYIFKEDLPYILPASGNPKPMNIQEAAALRSQYNGRNPINHNVYLYFPLGAGGLERFYGTTIDDIGPNLGEGLPEGRRGPITYMAGYPGSVFYAVDAGDEGYSSIMQTGGHHERYRAPLGQRILSMQFQPIPGSTIDRLWVYQGNDLIWLPFPSETTNETADDQYLHTHEFAITLSRMHAGLFDVQKLIRKLKLQTSDLEVNETTGSPICWFELDYRLNEDTDWTSIPNTFTESPTQEVDFIDQYGLSGKRIQFRVRGYTSDATKTPLFIAIIINAVLRTDVKYLYQTSDFRVMDNEPLLSGTQEHETMTADEKRQIIEDWSDASSDSMLLMRSVSKLFDDKMVFINPPQWRQIMFKNQEGNAYQRDIYIGRVTFQDA